MAQWGWSEASGDAREPTSPYFAAFLSSLKRLRNIADNPQCAVVVDRYDDDWSQLGWVMMRGRAEILDSGDEHEWAQDSLRLRYGSYLEMDLAGLPVVAIRIERVARWGNLAPTS